MRNMGVINSSDEHHSSDDVGNEPGGSDDGQTNQSEQSRQGVEESDSSEDEVAPRNTIGDVPLEWYKDEEHIGYDIARKKLKKKERRDKLDSFLASADDSKNWCHPKDVTNVAFHQSYPLFVLCSDDGTAYIFHGMVYSDLNQNPLIVPLEILRGHATPNGGGVTDCKFRPRQPWLFTAGADSVIKLFCH